MSDAEFLGIFRDEATRRLDHMVETLLAVESGRAAPDAVDSLFRDAHTIKGAAGMLGLDEIHVLAHAVEEILDGLRGSGEFPAELIDALLRAADSLRRHVEGAGEADGDLLDELVGQPRTDRAEARSTPRSSSRVSYPPSWSDGRFASQPRSSTGCSTSSARPCSTAGASSMRSAPTGCRTLESLSDELDVGERLLGDLQETAIEMRTLPLASITGTFPRAVRDIAAARGTEVELVVTGAETELDRVILEGISEPIVHILRNSVAHGIETPDGARTRGQAPGSAELSSRPSSAAGWSRS